VEAESFEPGAPDRIPDDLLVVYGKEARKTVRHNLSRRRRVLKRARSVVVSTDADLWQTTAVVFFLSVIAVCGIGGLVYAVYLWPTIGLSLVGTVLVLFTLSFLVARRISRQHWDPREHETTSLF
jgi:ABC-type multidrug transport system fused ATPase/permease subunit